MKGTKKIIDKQEAMARAEHFCAYQERSQQEVRNKLYSFNLPDNVIEQLISDLIESNFLNEERFAIAYALGKFRIKNWGKYKIKQGLKLKQVPDKLITKALKQLDETQYLETLDILLKKKADLIQEEDLYKLHYKLTQYALGKGYEKSLVSDVLKNWEIK